MTLLEICGEISSTQHFQPSIGKYGIYLHWNNSIAESCQLVKVLYQQKCVKLFWTMLKFDN